ncbi:MAG TPA: D-alanyl-D-alanine carboxypeptidase family protein, partial [Steroidobacteraceae bacterium]|nr:D-alanyl-D-alanine carboxypeptidase family protein [Steroidobacteraceae bacterium]
ILMDFQTGKVLAESNADAPMEPASITKLMTAYAAFKALEEGRLKLTDPVTISEHAWRSEGSRSFVQVGTQVPLEVLLKGMIVQSGNDATIAVAERVGGTEQAFAGIMNSYAKQLGMKNSNFENSSGLPGPQHRMSARDIAVLARAMIAEFPEYYRWYSLREFEWNGIKQQNRNGLLGRDPSVDGIKTGHTESAGYCLATSAERNGMRLISVVLGTASMKAREDASAALLNYGYTFYETVALKKKGEVLLSPRVYKGEVEMIPAVVARDVWATVPRGSAAALVTTTSVDEPLIAPLAADQTIGQVTIKDDASLVTSVPLVPQKAVAEGGWWSQLTDTVALWMR